jgi:ABC-type transport system involved in cytochrome c biogenesis permease component
MTLLPIVARELRTASRRKSTYRLRSWTAAGAMLSLSSVVFVGAFGGPPGQLGKPLFSFITSLTFGLCLLAGVFLSADCLSREKREGTLGLLFLTDLKGCDVVLGKFTASSLHAFYCLFALLPVLGLPLLLGGVTGGEFWRTALALTNVLFLSLAAGILSSAFGRNPNRVKGGTLWLLLVLAAGVPALAALVTLFRVPLPWTEFRWISPWWAFRHARGIPYLGGPREFWGGLIACHLLGWIFLAVASLILPRSWQDRPVSSSSRGSMGLLLRRSPADAAKPAELRTKLLPINPVLWLINRGSSSRFLVWALVGLWSGIMVLVSCGLVATQSESPEATLLSMWFLARPFTFALKALCALQACRFFAEARRDGALELLCCTPLSSKEIIRGQMLARDRLFLCPLLVFLGMWMLPSIVGLIASFFLANPTPLVPGDAVAAVGVWFGALYACVREVLDFTAVSWFGMWLALTLKKPTLASPLTILFVLVLPACICCFGDVLADLFFISWGISRLDRDLRRVVSKQYELIPGEPVSSQLPRAVRPPPALTKP